MNFEKADGALLLYFAYALTLIAFLLLHGAALDKAATLAFLATLLINRRPQ
jgi:hypothetical protein